LPLIYRDEDGWNQPLLFQIDSKFSHNQQSLNQTFILVLLN